MTGGTTWRKLRTGAGLQRRFMPKWYSPSAINKPQKEGKKKKTSNIKQNPEKVSRLLEWSFWLTATEMHNGPFSSSNGNSQARPEIGGAGVGVREREREGESERSVSLKVSLCNSGEKICWIMI